MKKKSRPTFDDLFGTEEPENFSVVVGKKGKPKVVRKNKPKKVPVPYEKQYPVFFSLLKQNPAIPDHVEEHVFHPVRKWRIDLAWPEFKLAVEIEGGTYLQRGGHRGSISGYLKDKEKYNALAVHGWWLLRVLPDEMEDCSAYDLICEWFNQNVPGFREKSIHRDAF